MFDQILIPTDGSEPARSAARRGIELARIHDAELHVLYVAEPVPLGRFTTGPEPAAAEHSEIVEQQREEGQAAIDEIVELAMEAGIETVEGIEFGSPHEEVISYAEDEGIDAIVMGTHGRSGVDRFLLGSVAEKVVRKSPIPVMTVRSGA